MYTEKENDSARYCTINSHYAILAMSIGGGVIVILMDFEGKKLIVYTVDEGILSLHQLSVYVVCESMIRIKFEK